MAAKRAELGLDKPFLIQYFNWLMGFLSGDLGNSYISGKNVFDTFISKLPNTLFLTVISILITVFVSLPLGIISAVKKNKFTDYFIRIVSFGANAMPGFFLGLCLCLYLV